MSSCMQDKKSRFYIVSALADTKVDMKGEFFFFFFLTLWHCKTQIGLAVRNADILLSFISWMLMGITCFFDMSSFVSKAWFGERRYKNGSWRSIGWDTSGICLDCAWAPPLSDFSIFISLLLTLLIAVFNK